MREYVQPWRSKTTIALPPPSPPTVRQATGWFLRHPDSLDADEHQHLQALTAAFPALAALGEHVRAFARRLVAEAYPREVRLTRDAALRLSGAASGTLVGRELPGEDVEAAIGWAERVWVVSRSYPKESDLASPRDEAKRRLLKDHYRQAEVTRVLGYAVRLYLRRD
ncbi:hypothetical protein ABZT47_35580 [Sphaerisporangium sp. NPDC005289]|uniref:hypothetical protein n=1 Tax=Sphaerisporangium sp. NPDC005289 TaxID=3155247 RepID=UPI0033B4023A